MFPVLHVFGPCKTLLKEEGSKSAGFCFGHAGYGSAWNEQTEPDPKAACCVRQHLAARPAPCILS